MTTLTFPSITPNESVWGLQANTQSFRSPFTGSVQTIEFSGARWVAELTFNNLTVADSRTLSAFLLQCRGSSGRFYLYDHSHSSPSGVGTGTPKVKGASQTGRSLNTDGWTTSQTGILKAGDYFTVNDELKIVTADANSDVTGNATISFEPPLRSSPADNATITVTHPTTIMMLSDDLMNWHNVPLFSSFTIKCEEAFSSALSAASWS